MTRQSLVGITAPDLGANTITAYMAPTNVDHVTRKDYVDARALPAGGAAGNVLAKNSATNYDVAWVAGGGGGGGLDQATADTLYVNVSGDSMTGTLTVKDALVVSGTGTSALVLNSPTPTERYVRFRTNNQDRWTFGATPSAEQGTDNGTGSDFSVARWINGVWVDNPIQVNRADGRIVATNGLVGYGDINVQHTGQAMITLKAEDNNMALFSVASPFGQLGGIVFVDGTTNKYRWAVAKGSGAGTDLEFLRFNDNGDMVDIPFKVLRSSGQVQVLQPLYLLDGTPTDNNHAASKWYVDQRTPKTTVGTTAPSNPATGDVWIDTT